MHSNLLFVKFFVVLIITCVALPNLSLNSSIFMLATVVYMFLPNLFLMFTNRLLVFQDGLKFQQNLNSIPAHNFQKLELSQSYT